MAVTKKLAKSRTAVKKKSAVRKKTAGKTASRRTPVKKKAAARKTAKKAAPKQKVTAKKAVPKKKTAVKKAPVKKARRRSSGSSQIGPVPGIAPYVEKRGEEYMNEDQVRHFKNILLAWKKGLMEEVDRTVHHMQDDAANFPDPNDRATQESEFSMELRARDRERKLIRKIDESMHNLDNEDYGYCEACGVEIGVRRLEARPTATLCIDCKILDEIREKQMG